MPCVVEGGRIDFRANAEAPPPAFATRWLSLAPSMLKDGQNRLSVTLAESDPDAKSPAIVIDEVEIHVEPR